jgi:hypothetical protein
MDLDSVLVNLGFSFANWRKECTNRKLCFRCLKSFDQAHQDARGCILPEDCWLEKNDILKVWKMWGGALREDQTRSPYPSNNCFQSSDKGKKRESISEMDGQHTMKHRSVSGPLGGSIPPTSSTTAQPFHPVASTSIPLSDHLAPSAADTHLDLLMGEPMSIGEILFIQKLGELELGNEDEGKSCHVVKTISSFN